MKFPISIDYFAQKVEILCESTWCMQINTKEGMLTILETYYY